MIHTLLVISLLGFPASPSFLQGFDVDKCLARATDAEAIIKCHDKASSPETPTENDPQVSEPTTLETYEYTWLPACPGAFPTVAEASSMSCAGEQTCTQQELVRQALWSRQLTDARGRNVQEGWRFEGSECRDPVDARPVDQRRALTWNEVLSAVKRVGVPAATVHAPGYTLVNLDTTFYTETQTIDRSLDIISYDVDVAIRPTGYTWHWGDGSTSQTETPGSPYPSTEVTHTYVHATEEQQTLELSVDVTYTARYRVDGGDWQAIPDTLTIPGTATDLPVKQAASVLVADD